MGLDIYGLSTGGHISGSYSRLHYTVRYLALLYCGMPKYLDNEDEISAMSIYMYPFLHNKRIDLDKMRQFIYAVQVSGIEFPNVLLHSDCEGKYTKRGKIDLDGPWHTGNSISLLKELEKLVNEEVFQSESYAVEMTYTKAFYDLVKKEVEEGKGIIEFR